MANIHDVYEAVHDAKSRDIDIQETLKEYGLTKSVFYHACERAGLKSWRAKSRDSIFVSKPIRPIKPRDKDPPKKTEKPTKKDRHHLESDTDGSPYERTRKESGGLRGGNMPTPKKHPHKREAANPSTLTELENRLYKLNNG